MKKFLTIAFVMLAVITSVSVEQIPATEEGSKILYLQSCPTIIEEGYNRKTCWAQSGMGIIPNYGYVLTAQQEYIEGSDVFYAIQTSASHDQGKSWSPMTEQATLPLMNVAEGKLRFTPTDSTPKWHAASQKLLTTGALAWYAGRDQLEERMALVPEEERLPGMVPCSTFYSVYDTENNQWGELKFLMTPETSSVCDGVAGWTQRVDLPDGTILLPVYTQIPNFQGTRFQTVVLHCSFDGSVLRYLNEGPALSLDIARGLYEPSLIAYNGKYWLTLRNDEKGYVAVSDDGLHFSEPVPWRWKEDGQEIGSYNTQQHWVIIDKKLCLVYTRRGADNDHIIRNRAPLFVAQFDPETQTLIRETEIIAVPERGAGLGNFSVGQFSDSTAYIITTECMQSIRWPAANNFLDCEKRGSNSAVWMVRLSAQTNRDEKIPAKTVVLLGDSTTAPNGDVVTYTTLLENYCRDSHQSYRFINSGVPGAKTSDAVKDFDSLVKKHHPDILVIQFGINDSAINVWETPPKTEPRISREEFKANLHWILNQAKEMKIAAILMTTNQIRWSEKTKKLYGHSPYDASNPRSFNDTTLADYNEAIREVAKESEIPLVDIYNSYEDMEHYGSPDTMLTLLLPDAMHPSNEGHRLVYGKLLSILFKR